MKENKRSRGILGRVKKDFFFVLPAVPILAGYFILTSFLFGTVCPSVILFGIACPGCGMTRAVFSLFTGNVGAAFRYNPAVFIWIPYLLYLGVFRYFAGKSAPAVWPVTIFVCVATFLLYILL